MLNRNIVFICDVSNLLLYKEAEKLLFVFNWNYKYNS